jgi:hypothetical protein
MNNKRLNLAIIDQVWQTSAEACVVWCIHECGGSGGCSGGSCTCGNGMPCYWKYACECNLLVIQIKCSILQKLIVHNHTYLQHYLLLRKCRVSLLFSLPIVLLHLQVVLFIPLSRCSIFLFIISGFVRRVLPPELLDKDHLRGCTWVESINPLNIMHLQSSKYVKCIWTKHQNREWK